MQFRVFITIGAVSVDVQVLRRPLLTVRHPPEGMHPTDALWSFAALRATQATLTDPNALSATAAT
jgi:hypothetical protein